MVKRLRHRPFTAVTGVQIPLESLRNSYADVAQFSRNKDCVHDGNIRRTNACIDVRLMFSLHRRLHRERENEVFERHAESNVKRECADVAQLAEQLICNQQVNGSSPFIGFHVRTCSSVG